MVHDELTEEIEMSHQGCIFSPLLFNLCSEAPCQEKLRLNTERTIGVYTSSKG